MRRHLGRAVTLASLAALGPLGCGSRPAAPLEAPVEHPTTPALDAGTRQALADAAPATAATDGRAAPQAAPDAGAGPQLAVRWTEAIELGSLAEVDAALRAPITDPPELLCDGGTTRLVRSCLESIELHAKGCSAAPISGDPWAGRCRPLEMLKAARPARSSHVADIDAVDRPALAVLPAALGTAMSPEEEQHQKRAASKGQSWLGYAPRARIEAGPTSGPYEFRVNEGNGNGALVKIMAWGDFDGDGSEDLMVNTVNYVLEGRAFYERLLVLTRTAPDEVLRVVSDEMGQTY
jgi:hypothetical protein